MPLDAPADALTPTARLVLLALREGPADTSTLRSRTGTPKASFFRAVATLEARGLIERVRTPGKGNRYTRVLDS